MENSTISISSRIDARMAISAAVAKMPRTSSFEITPSGGTRATFRPSVTKKSADRSPQTAQPEPRKHRYPTTERVMQLLVGGVKRNLDRGMGRPQALDAARSWLLDEVLAKNEDVKDEDRAARTDQVKNLDAVAFWTSFDAKRVGADQRVRPVQEVATQPVAISSESLLAALAGADQVTAGDDLLEISDEPEIPVVQKPVPVGARSARPDRKATPQQERGLKRLPLTTPGHLDDVFALFVERHMANGHDEETAFAKARGRLFAEIESEDGLSPNDVERLKREVRAKRPRLTTDRVEELLLRFAKEATAAGYNRPEAAGEATDRMMRIIRNVVAPADQESLFNCMKNWLQTSFTQPIVDAGGATLDEIDEAVTLSKETFAASHEEYFGEPKPKRRHQGPRQQGGFVPPPAPARHETVASSPETEPEKPKTVALKGLTPEEKKAERIRRAEASAAKSRDPHACAMKATTEPKKQKKDKGRRGQQANAQA